MSLTERLVAMLERDQHSGLEDVEALREHYAPLGITPAEVIEAVAAYVGIPTPTVVSLASRMYELGYEAGARAAISARDDADGLAAEHHDNEGRTL